MTHHSLPHEVEAHNATGAGLSYVPYLNNSPSHTYELAVYAGGVHVTCTSQIPDRQPPPPPRGEISDFSKRSRNRMLKRLATMRVDWRTCHFITLTYPGEFTSSQDEVKYHMKRFHKWILYHYPTACGIWRIELKERKSGASQGEIVPHYHVLLYNAAIDDLTDFREDVSEAWNTIVGGDYDHLQAGTNVQRIRNRRHATHYVSKYSAKAEDDIPQEAKIGWGRRWATFGDMDCTDSLKLSLNEREFVIFRRLIAAWLKSQGSKYHKRLCKSGRYRGFFLFGLGDESIVDAKAPPIARFVRHARELAALRNDFERYGVVFW